MLEGDIPKLCRPVMGVGGRGDDRREEWAGAGEGPIGVGNGPLLMGCQMVVTWGGSRGVNYISHSSYICSF